MMIAYIHSVRLRISAIIALMGSIWNSFMYSNENELAQCDVNSLAQKLHHLIDQIRVLIEIMNVLRPPSTPETIDLAMTVACSSIMFGIRVSLVFL